MRKILEQVERAMPELLSDKSQWQSLFVDYEKPFVERLWRPFGEYRVSLHRIQTCEREESLFHTHPWPSVMRIVEGRYEMGVGYGSGSTAPKVAATMILPGGSSYEMVEPDGWHYVRPIGGPVYSLMVSGKPWQRESPKSQYQLPSLSEAEVERLWQFFCQKYNSD